MQNCHNHQVGNAIAKAMTKAKGDFIARMDADDISLPTRLEKQVAYLQKHPKTVAVGSQCLLIDQNNSIIGEKKFPTKFKDIYNYIYSFCPVQHPTLLINRRKLPKNFHMYNPSIPVAEDMELLFRLFRFGKVENLSDFLFMYRIHGKNHSLMHLKKSFLLTLLARLQGVFSYGYRPTPKGVLVTIVQTITILVLPEAVSLQLYKFVKRIVPIHFGLQDSVAMEVAKVL